MPALRPFPVCDRRVRRLRLRAGDPARARRVAIALGDALHTASLPDGDAGRLLAIRRLALGRIAADTSAASLALRLERAVREVTTHAISFDAPGAHAAETVAFPSRVAALTALARLHAGHGDTTAWYWNQVAPGWSESESRPARWRILLNTAHEGEGAALVAAAVVAAAVRAASGAVPEIFAAISPDEAALWLFATGFLPAVPGREVPPSLPFVSATIAETLTRARRLPGTIADADAGASVGEATRGETRFASEDARLAWLGVMLVLDGRPAYAARAELPAQIAAWLKSSRRESAPLPAADEFSAPADRTAAAIEPSPEMETSRSLSSPPATPAAPAPERDGTRESAACEDDAYSTHAGLLFLVPILRRLGLARHLAQHPELLEAAFPARLLGFIGRRAGLREDDPLARALAALVGDETDDLTPAWRYDAWLAAVRTWCRRRARLAWRDLVLRPGRVRAAPAHLDVCFDPAQADIRLRRLALDADPGWVPWLGCVIHFHYVAPDEQPR